MAIHNEAFEGARFKVERPMKTRTSVSYCTTEQERDALVESIKAISGKRARFTVTDLANAEEVS